MKRIADYNGVNIVQISIAWAIAKGTLPIIGVTKVSHVEDFAKAINLKLTDIEFKMLEAVADKMNLNVIRVWEKKLNNREEKIWLCPKRV